MTEAHGVRHSLLGPKDEKEIRYIALLHAKNDAVVDILIELLGYREFPLLLLYDGLNAIFDYHERVCWSEAQVLLQSALLAAEAGEPPVDLDGPAETAKHWACMASPRELEMYLRAIVKQLGRGPMLDRARKTLLVDLWEGLSAQDRREFLRRAGADGFARRSA